MGSAHLYKGQLDSSLIYYKQALKICNDHNLDEWKAFSYNNLGIVYLRTADYMEALSYYDTGAHIAKKNNNKTVLARIKSNIGSVYYEQGLYSPALKNFLEGLKIHEELGNQKDISLSVLNLSNVYYRLKDYPKAKKYISRAMDMAKESDDKWSVISCHTTYASIYNEEKKYDSSLICLQEALQLSVAINQPYVTNLLKGNIAECYLHLGKLDSAYTLFKESLVVSEQIQDPEGVAIAKGGIGQILVKKGETAKGIKYMEESLAILQATGMKQQVLELTEILAQSNENIGNYKNTVKYIKLKETYRDSLALDETRKEAKNLQFEYELDKKSARIALLEKDKAIEKSKADTQRILLISALAGMVLAIIIALLFFRNLRNIKKSNELILIQKQEIEHQAEKLKALNKFKDTTFSVLSHDLRSPINALTGTMAMLDEGIITPQEFTAHKHELVNKLQSVTLMLDNLLYWAKSQMQGEHTLNIEKLNVRRNVLKSFAILKDAAQQKNIILTTTIPEELYVYADQNQVEMILRNLLSNAIKFTPENGTVSVTARRDDAFVAISVTDTGIGMTEAQAEKLFDGNTNASTIGTNGEKGTGIGLRLSFDFIKNNGGNIAIKSNQGAGSTFTVKLPANKDK